MEAATSDGECDNTSFLPRDPIFPGLLGTSISCLLQMVTSLIDADSGFQEALTRHEQARLGIWQACSHARERGPGGARKGS